MLKMQHLIPHINSITTIDRGMLDYYPFGSVMPGRSIGKYRYTFNGKETDDESKTQDYGFRIYNSSLGKFLSVDPLTKDYPWYTPYQFAGNKPIWAIDLDGLEEAYATNYYNLDWEMRPHVALGKFVANIGMHIWNGGVYTLDITLNDFGRRGPSGVINRINNDLDNFSLNIANDMIHAKRVEGIKTGVSYILNRAQKPEVWEAALAALISRRMGAPSSTRKLTITSRMSLAEKIDIRKRYVQNKYSSAIERYGENHIDYTKSVRTVNNNGSLVNGKKLVQYRDPSNPNASTFFTYEGVDPLTLGIPKTHTQKYYVTLPENQTFDFLETTANKVKAFSPQKDPGINGCYNGGGTQLYCPEASKVATFTPAP